ncbi:MAG: beta-galactosidase [Verrucomicrobia bacterium]|nr:beta-galactosidase [Verrucomicrobiota bacterium]
MNKLLFGVAYYPEHDPEEEWGLDAKLMQELGLNCIRIGEFCWSRLQQSDGAFTLDWLNRVIDLYDAHGIKTILCTPTATPPVWMADRYPDLPCLTPDGRQGLFGGRRHYSVFHEGYRTHCREIAAALSARFGRHPGVIGWQIDNEIGTYSAIDCSAPALRAFQHYVEKKYGTVAELNRRWGLIFWNQEIERFDQIPAPTVMLCTRNPSYLLDYNRFSFEGMAEFMLNQAAVIRQHAGPQFIVGSGIEAAQSAVCRLQQERGIRQIDEISVHNYPEMFATAGEMAMMLDRHRALSPAGRFLVLEQQNGSGYTTTSGLNPAIRRCWAFHSLAHGANSILWFQWRRFRTGCEWRHPCVVERDRRKRAPYQNIRTIVAECQKARQITGPGRVVSDAQILFSLDNAVGRDRASEGTFWLEIQLPDGVANRVPMWEKETLRAAYNPLAHLGLTLEFVTETSAWDVAKPLIIPDLDICSEPTARKLQDWCARGGTLICFPGAGERDEFGAQRNLCPPGILAPLFGVELFDYWQLETAIGATFDPARIQTPSAEAVAPPKTVTPVKFGSGEILFDVRHGEVLELKNAQPLGSYTTGPFKGMPAVAQRTIGPGRAIYLGAVPADAHQAILLYRALLPGFPAKAIAHRTVKLESSTGQYAFLLNDSPHPSTLDTSVRDLITDTDFEELPAWGVALVRR